MQTKLTPTDCLGIACMSSLDDRLTWAIKAAKDANLGSTAASILNLLAYRADEKEQASFSIDELSADARCHRRTTFRAMDSLLSKGLIKKQTRPGLQTLYTLQIAPPRGRRVAFAIDALTTRKTHASDSPHDRVEDYLGNRRGAKV